MPELDLDWELGVFKALRALWRRVSPEPAPPYDATRAATLETLQDRLRVVASVVGGGPLRVLPGRDIGGVRGADLLLPPHIDLASDPEANAGLYVIRAAVGALVSAQQAEVPHDPLHRAVVELVGGGRALVRLRAELPAAAETLAQVLPLVLAARPAPEGPRGRQLEDGLRSVVAGGPLPEPTALLAALRDLPEGPLPPPCWLWGHLLPVQVDGAAEPAADGPHTADDGGITTELAAPPTAELQLVLQGADKIEDLPAHAFEKVETLEAFAGSMRQLDGADELEEHLEALEEVDLTHLIRGGPPVRSQYSADLRLGVDLPDVGSVAAHETGIPYDEWDGRTRRYLPAWCHVYPSPCGPGDAAWARGPLQRHRREIDRLTQQVLATRARLRPARRQLAGDDVDIDALVASHGAIRAGRSRDPRLYLRRQRPEPELAVTLLLDVSLSADSWVDGHRVLDLTREAALVLGEVSHRVGQPLQVLAFASHTRNRVRVWGVRDWHEPWSTGRARLGALRPQGYTRIGPALRHAAAGLARAPARQRLLLLLTDGKPNDFDRYEGRHGIADVRRAIREAHDHGIVTHAVAVDHTARDDLPQMLGPGGWSIVSHPDALAGALSAVYVRLAACSS